MTTRIEDIERKRRYLEVAETLATEDVAGESAFGHLVAQARLADVAERLGVARTALYRPWPTQHDYRVDLATYVAMRASARRQLLQAARHLEGAPGAGMPGLLEACRRCGNAIQPHLGTDPQLALRAGALGYPAPQTIAAARAGVERRARHDAAHHVAAALRHAGRRPVAPLTVADLTTMLGIAIDGTASVARRAPDIVPTGLTLDADASRPWSLLAFAIRCFLTELTEAGAVSDPPSGDGLDAEGVDPWARWTPAQERALAAGAEIVEAIVGGEQATEGDEITALGHVTLDRVARRAGVSRRHLYNVWESQSAFRADLMIFFGDQEREDYFGSFDQATVDAMAGASDPADLTLAICEQINRHRHDGSAPKPRPHYAFRALFSDPEIRRRLHASQRRVLDEQEERLHVFAELLGLEPRQGLTVRDVTLLFMIAAGGSEVLHRLDPQAIRVDLPYRDGRWSSFSIACQAIVTHSTVPSSATPSSATP